MGEEIKLSEDELSELQRRESIAKEHELIADSVRMEARILMNQVLEERGMDLKKKYNIDLDTGVVELVEE